MNCTFFQEAHTFSKQVQWRKTIFQLMKHASCNKLLLYSCRLQQRFTSVELWSQTTVICSGYHITTHWRIVYLISCSGTVRLKRRELCDRCQLAAPSFCQSIVILGLTAFSARLTDVSNWIQQRETCLWPEKISETLLKLWVYVMSAQF